jgi:hypothetical protein
VNELFLILLELTNETLAAAIVVIAASLLLYNLTRNWTDRVTRTASLLLACVTVAYMADVLVSLGPGLRSYANFLRLQWVGIAFIPAALFHLSDALLATTGKPSRGRRRKVVRVLYAFSTVFLLLAAFTNLLIQPVQGAEVVSLRAKPLFPVYTIFFIIATASAFINVQRARQRCLTRATRRRMAYLQVAMLTPALGIFPFSVLLGPGQEFSLEGILLVNLANFVVIMMLLFLAYPLSFFGSRIPDRVVKAELLRFLMRGPATGLLALATIIFTTQATRILGLPGQSFMPFAVVAVVLLWQWITALSLPWLERRLIYPSEEGEQLGRLQDLSERLLTRTDLLQLLEAILGATCDYLRVSTAFVSSLNDNGGAEPELIATIGPTRPSQELLQEEIERLHQLLAAGDPAALAIYKWHSFWIAPLTSARNGKPGEDRSLIGFLGVQARSAEIDLTPDEQDMFNTLIRRAEQTLDDLTLQGEVLAALEGLLPQFNIDRARAAAVEYRPADQASESPQTRIDREQFTEQVKAALKHYWGGPGLSHSRLLELEMVRAELPNNDQNPVKALRAVLQQAIEKQKPDGDRKMTSPEWTLYNILDLRFIQKKKVREVAQRLALSEPDLYRKQRVAIDAVAETILDVNNHHPPD